MTTLHRILPSIALAAALSAADPMTIDRSRTAVFEPGALTIAGYPMPAVDAVSAPVTLNLATTTHWNWNHIFTFQRHGIFFADAAGVAFARATPNSPLLCSSGNNEHSTLNSTNGDLYAYRNMKWSLTVPLAITKENGADRVYTPEFGSTGWRQRYTNGLATSGGVPGVMYAPSSWGSTVQVGVWSAANSNDTWSTNAINLYKDGLLAARARGNGAYISAGLILGLAVVRVRTAIENDGTGRIRNVYTEVPFVLTRSNMSDILNPGTFGRREILTPTNNAPPGSSTPKTFDHVGLRTAPVLASNG